MRFKKITKYIAFCAALAMAVPMALTAYAAEPDEPGGQTHEHIVSDSNPDPAWRHGPDCLQDTHIDGVAVTIRASDYQNPEDPDDYGEFRHNDMFCYKTGVNASADIDENNAATGSSDGEGDASVNDGIVHGAGCWQEYDEPDGSGAGAGFVEELDFLEHDDSLCHKAPYKSDPFPDDLKQEQAQPAATAPHVNTQAAGINPDADAAIENTVDDGIEGQAMIANYLTLPATGGEGLAGLAIFGVLGLFTGVAAMMALRKREA